MKKLSIVVVIVALIGLVGFTLLPNNKPQDQPRPVANNNQPEQVQPVAEQPKPNTALSFWTGEVIIGEGPKRGQIELVAAPGKSAVIIVADEKGVCRFDAIDGMEVGLVYIVLRERGHAPLISLAVYEDGKEVEMHPVYGASQAVKDGKITPFIAPDILSPAERRYRAKGQQLEGYTWSIRSYDSQVYSRERSRNENVHYESTAIKLAPSVEVKFSGETVDLTQMHFSNEELETMAQDDVQRNECSNKNSERVFRSAVGTWKIVSCFGRHSTNANATNCGGHRCDSLQLPNGKWCGSFPDVQKVLDLNGQVYVVCYHEILKWVDNDTLESVVSFKGNPYIQTMRETKDGMIKNRFIPVNKTSGSDFGGLLEYKEGTWLFHQYDGDYRAWVDSTEDEDGHLVLILFSPSPERTGKRIQFDPTAGTFTDL